MHEKAKLNQANQTTSSSSEETSSATSPQASESAFCRSISRA